MALQSSRLDHKTTTCNSRNVCFCLLFFLILVAGTEACLTHGDNGNRGLDSLSHRNHHFYSDGVITEADREAEWEFPLPHQLRKWKLKNYDVSLPPTFIQGEPTPVRINIDLRNFVVDEPNSMIFFNSRVTLEWKDVRLALPKTGINNPQIRSAELMYYSDLEIWWPEISVENDNNLTLTDPSSSLLGVDFDGKVRWRFPVKLASKCPLNNLLWPFDFQICNLTITMGSFTNGNMMDLKMLAAASSKLVDTVNFRYFQKNPEWDLYKYHTTRKIIPCEECEEPQVQITFSFPIVRNPPYSTFVLLPITFIIAVNILLFLVPSLSGEKIGLAAFNCVNICVLFIYAYTVTAFASDRLYDPLLIQLYTANLVWIVTSLMIYITVNYTPFGQRPPRCILRIGSVLTGLHLQEEYPDPADRAVYFVKNKGRQSKGVPLENYMDTNETLEAKTSTAAGAPFDDLTHIIPAPYAKRYEENLKSRHNHVGVKSPPSKDDLEVPQPVQPECNGSDNDVSNHVLERNGEKNPILDSENPDDINNQLQGYDEVDRLRGEQDSSHVDSDKAVPPLNTNGEIRRSIDDSEAAILNEAHPSDSYPREGNAEFENQNQNRNSESADVPDSIPSEEDAVQQFLYNYRHGFPHFGHHDEAEDPCLNFLNQFELKPDPDSESSSKTWYHPAWPKIVPEMERLAFIGFVLWMAYLGAVYNQVSH